MKGFNYHKSNRKILTVYLLIFIFSFTFSGCSLLPVEEEVKTSEVISIKDMDYKLYEVKKKDFIYNVIGTGVFVSSTPCDCVSEFGGSTVEKVFVKKGDNVKKGDILIEFDKGDLEYQLKEQRLSLEAAKYNYKEACKQKINNAEIEKAKILMSIQESKLCDLEEQIEETQLRAPVGGIIIDSENLQPGQSVSANTFLFRIADPNKLNLRFTNKKEATYKDPKANDSLVKLKNDTQVMILYNNNQYKGTVLGMDQSNNGYMIKMNTVPEGAGLGSSIVVTLNIINKKNVIAIPKKAIKVKDEKFYCLVLENGLRVKKDVQVGVESDSQIEIIKGLKDGDKVILN